MLEVSALERSDPMLAFQRRGASERLLQPSSADCYFLDEVSALVLDPGYSSVRAGFAGEDTPKSIIPTYYADTGSQRLFGDHVIDVPREDVAIKNPMSRDGLVEDWDAAEELWRSSFANKLTGVRPNHALQEWLNHPESVKDLQKAMADAVDTEKCLEDHPLFMTEQSWNEPKHRMKMAEIALESWATPAFYLGRNGVMGAFAAGRASALVIDFGASQLSITPVHDGMILKKGVVKANIGGNYLTSQVRSIFAANEPQPIVITPHYLVKSKQPVESGQPADAILREFSAEFKPPQASFRRYQEDKVVQEFKELTVATWSNMNMPFRANEEGIEREQQNIHSFEFPDGYNQTFSSERYRATESMFDPQCYTPPSAGSEDTELYPAPDAQHTLPALVRQSLNQVDVDIRPLVLANVIITGGGSLIKGMSERIYQELQRMYPSTKVKM